MAGGGVCGEAPRSRAESEKVSSSLWHRLLPRRVVTRALVPRPATAEEREEYRGGKEAKAERRRRRRSGKGEKSPLEPG